VNKFLNQKGSIAIMMVITAVILITPVVVNFTFDTNIAKLKVYNIEQKAKAKLTAESGLKFAMARLRLYKEAYNYVQNNKALKDSVKPQILDMLWNFPFIYPVPITNKTSLIQKQGLEKFHEEVKLDGNLTLSIANISNKINLNMVRISLLNETEKKRDPNYQPPTEDEMKFSVESQLFTALKNGIDAKLLVDDVFNAKHSGIEVNNLVDILKLNITDPVAAETMENSQMSLFQDQNSQPKYSPFMSFSEVYTLPEWSDDLVALVENEFTVHGAMMIDLNQITDKMLKLLFPEITEDESAEFFKYKNDPDDPKHFNSTDEFKNYVVNIGHLMKESEFDTLMANFKKLGVQFGPTPTLFKIISSAKLERGSYTITAYVTIPTQPEPRKQVQNTENQTSTQTPQTPENPSTPQPPAAPQTPEKPETKTLLLNPRIVEITVS